MPPGVGQGVMLLILVVCPILLALSAKSPDNEDTNLEAHDLMSDVRSRMLGTWTAQLDQTSRRITMDNIRSSASANSEISRFRKIDNRHFNLSSTPSPPSPTEAIQQVSRDVGRSKGESPSF